MEALGGTQAFPAIGSCIYLDTASVSMIHAGAAEARIEWQRRLAQEGTLAFDEPAEVEIFEGLRSAAARLWNARPEDIAVGASETIHMSSLAWGIAPKPGRTIVATRASHPSTTYPWVRVAQHTGATIRWVDSEDQYTDPERLLAAIDDRTAVVCVSHVEYGAGQQYDLARIATAAHRHGALLIVDATQSAGQIPIDVGASGVDALASSTYKWLCGPFGAALMYVSPGLQALNPGIVGWRSHEDMWDFQADRLVLPRGARRFEFGTMAYDAALGVTVAIEYLLSLGVERIAAHNRAIAARLLEGLEQRGARILSPRDPAQRSAIVAARFPERDSPTLVAGLKRRGVVVSPRRDFIRFSPHFYNSSRNIEDALAEIDRQLG
jgi:selenocysteine lyase/cysteine desulfurase